MIYTYPRPQSVFKNTLFLIGETVNSGKYTEYQIPFKRGDTIHMKVISHEMLMTLIERGLVKLAEKPGAFNDKPFYRIPLQTQLTLF